MPIKIYNTLSRKKETLAPPSKKTLNLFVCGPTVYDYVHIGNARVYAFFDTLVRFLRSQKYKVFYLQNITDIDDKIIARAKREKTDWRKIAKKYERIFKQNMRDLNIATVDKYANASKFIPQIIRQIKILIRKKQAYKIPGDGYYFDIKSFPDYGKLARRTVEQAEDGVSRIDKSKNKRNRGDFCLWKLTDAKNARMNANDAKKKFRVINGEPAWRTELGWGRPGWHIEDTAITGRFFGPQYDLHGAAVDLKFPHHEAEIAQAESASGKKPFVRIWMHVGFLTVGGGKKMSKSSGNFISINGYLKRHSTNSFRLLILGTHYRSPLVYSEELSRDAENALAAIYEFAAKLDLRARAKTKIGRPKSINMGEFERKFSSAMADDINTPRALAAVFDLINQANKIIWNLKPAHAGELKRHLSETLRILGIKLAAPKIPKKIRDLAKKRELLRTNKQFSRSDALRKKINRLGYKVEDTPIGPLALITTCPNH